MPTRILDSTEATAGGILTLLSTGFIQLYEYITMENINDVLELFLAIGGAVFLYYKIRGQRLENESKKLDNEAKRKELNK
jgi:predicted transcriptional regulator